MHAIRIDEILLRRGGTGNAKIIAPNIPEHEEAALGRPFGFICINVPRSPQIDALIAETESVIENSYNRGTLKPGQLPELFFEETVGKVREAIASTIANERIKVDPSLMTIVLGCVFQGNLYLTRHGRAEAYLIRRETDRPTKTVDIFRGMSSDSDERLLNDMVIGVISPNDLLLVAAGSLFETCPIADIVEATEHCEPAAVAARIRSIILSVPGSESVAGCLARLAPVRAIFRAKDNVSVSNLRSREEEVARTLAPSGFPGVGAFLNRFKPKEKTKPIKLIKSTTKKQSIIEHFNNLPIAVKRAALILLALIAIFTVSLKLISIGNTNKEKENAYSSTVETIKKQIDLAESTVIYDEARARSIFEGAASMQQTLAPVNKNQTAQKAELEKLLTEADRKIKHLFVPTTTTLETLKSSANFVVKTANGWLSNDGVDLVLLDANGSPKTIATLPDTPTWAAVAADTDGSIYLWLKNNTLVTISSAANSLPRSLDYAGPQNPRAGAMWGGRLYVLTSDGSQIWKLPPTLTGFGRGGAWLTSPIANAAGLMIDGAIYTAIPNDAVRRFEKGKITPFAAGGASGNTTPLALQVTTNNVYLLGNDRTIAAWSKEGKLTAQYTLLESEGTVTAFSVDEVGQTIVYTTSKGTLSKFEIAK